MDPICSHCGVGGTANTCPRCQWPIHEKCLAEHGFRCRGVSARFVAGQVGRESDHKSDRSSQQALDLPANGRTLLTSPQFGLFVNAASAMNPPEVPSVDRIRSAAHDVAIALSHNNIGGECYHGGRHVCFTRQGRKPLGLYKVSEMCERCALTWYAMMTASVLDQIVFSQLVSGVNNDVAVAAEQPPTPESTTGTLQCPTCPKTFTRKNALYMHMRYCTSAASAKKGKK